MTPMQLHSLNTLQRMAYFRAVARRLLAMTGQPLEELRHEIGWLIVEDNIMALLNDHYLRIDRSPTYTFMALVRANLRKYPLVLAELQRQVERMETHDG